MDIAERINTIIRHYGYTASEFADTIEVPRSSISHITSGRNKPSLDFVIKVKNRFPEIRWDWLIDGLGEMTNKIPSAHNTVESDLIKEEKVSAEPDLATGESSGASTPPFPENERTAQNEESRESIIPDRDQTDIQANDSQQLGSSYNFPPSIDEKLQQRQVKRIVFFYTDGKFESFEP